MESPYGWWAKMPAWLKFCRVKTTCTRRGATVAPGSSAPSGSLACSTPRASGRWPRLFYKKSRKEEEKNTNSTRSHRPPSGPHCNENPIYVFLFFLGIARPRSQFPHLCVCERFIYSQDWSTYFHAAE
jgi:hypothetical protein